MKIGLACLLLVAFLGLTVTGWTSQGNLSAASSSSSSVANQNTDVQQEQQQQTEIEITEEELSPRPEVEKPLTKREIYEKRMAMTMTPDSLGEATAWVFAIILGVLVATFGFGGASELKKRGWYWIPLVGILYLIGSAGLLFSLAMTVSPFLVEAHVGCWPICNHFGPL